MELQKKQKPEKKPNKTKDHPKVNLPKNVPRANLEFGQLPKNGSDELPGGMVSHLGKWKGEIGTIVGPEMVEVQAAVKKIINVTTVEKKVVVDNCMNRTEQKEKGQNGHGPKTPKLVGGWDIFGLKLDGGTKEKKICQKKDNIKDQKPSNKIRNALMKESFNDLFNLRPKVNILEEKCGESPVVKNKITPEDIPDRKGAVTECP